MQNDSERSFEYGYTTDSSYSYLVLEFNSEIKPLIHQVEIVCQNPNSSFLPFHIRREDENVNIYYNVTSKISLSQYLERKQLNKKELLDLLRSITRSLMLHSNYLLDLSGFMIDKDFIYINPATAEAALVYIPVSSTVDAVEAYKFFLKDLIVNSASVDDHAKDNYLQRILNYLKSEAFSLKDFDRLIMDLRNIGGLNEPINRPIQVYRERPVSEEAAAAGYTSRVVNPIGTSFGRTAESKRILGIILLQLLILLAVVIICLFLISQAIGDMISVTGVIVIAAAVDMLIMNRIMGKQEKQARNAGIDNDNAIPKPRHNTDNGSKRINAKSHDVLRACDTIMISEASESDNPYLESAGIHMGERVIINKDKFIIGRLGSMVDYVVQGSTVGKLHAEISANGGIYCVRDLNSKNGTYVNDVRIPSNKEFEIKCNDRIRFANFEYVFKQQKTL